MNTQTSITMRTSAAILIWLALVALSNESLAAGSEHAQLIFAL
ncbi:MAG: hypothetical protein P8M73_03160 [Luminiphilus sp.]|nr:hypothetical protein [Luminiphilus sp.]